MPNLAVTERELAEAIRRAQQEPGLADLWELARISEEAAALTREQSEASPASKRIGRPPLILTPEEQEELKERRHQRNRGGCIVKVELEFEIDERHSEECDPYDYRDCESESDLEDALMEESEANWRVSVNKADLAALWAAILTIKKTERSVRGFQPSSPGPQDGHVPSPPPTTGQGTETVKPSNE